MPAIDGNNADQSYLRCEDVHKRLGEQPVVRGVSFNMTRGESLALLGPSGCGKTTLLNMIAGILPTDRGTIVCDSETLDAHEQGVYVPMRKRRFAMVFQDFSLWPHMTVTQNVAFGLRYNGSPRSQRASLIKTALERVHMQDFADRHPAQLSGGQQQRVAIARALAVKPRVLLLDEPLSALDARLREELREELSALIRSLHMTTIFVTHDQIEALTMADRIAVMREGVIDQIGSPQEVYGSPASAYVAEFVGSANLYDVSRRADTILLNGCESVTNARTTTKSISCMIRRESIAITNGDDATHHNGSVMRLRGKCIRSSYLGDRYDILAQTESGLTIRGLSLGNIEPQSPLTIDIPAEAMHWLQR